jgi:hypothetical protein
VRGMKNYPESKGGLLSVIRFWVTLQQNPFVRFASTGLFVEQKSNRVNISKLELTTNISIESKIAKFLFYL